MDSDEGRDLIERAMAGVRVVTCTTCAGQKTLPKGLHIICPRCYGDGVVVTTEASA